MNIFYNNLFQIEIEHNDIGSNVLKFSRTQSWDNIIFRLMESYAGIIDNYKIILRFKTIKAA